MSDIFSWRDLEAFELNARLVNPQQRTITYQQQVDKIQDKVMHTLCLLIANKNQVVSHQEIIEQVWQDNYLVGKKGLSNAIWQIRKLIGDTESSPIIETIPRVGYRLLLKTEQTNKPVHQKIFKQYKITTLALLVILLSASLYFLINSQYSSITPPYIFTINDALNNPKGITVYRPKFSPKVEQYLNHTAENFPILKRQIYLSENVELPKPDGKTWVLYGHFDNHPLLKTWQDKLNIKISTEAISLNGEVYQGDNLRLIVATFHPQDRNTPIIIYTTATPTGLLGIHKIWHGQTSWIVADRFGKEVASGNTHY